MLEHTPDPVAVLKQLREAATDDATFIISVPNVAHLAVRLMLLFGKFPKMERGILDRTHLQFFTKDTALDMLQGGGAAGDKRDVHRRAAGRTVEGRRGKPASIAR